MADRGRRTSADSHPTTRSRRLPTDDPKRPHRWQVRQAGLAGGPGLPAAGLPLILLALVAALPGAALPLTPDEPSAAETALEGQPSLEDQLAELCHRFRQGTNPYFGHGQIAELEARLEELEDGPGTAEEPLLRVRLLGRLATELNRVGRNLEALARLEQARLEEHRTALSRTGPEPPTKDRRELLRDLQVAEILIRLQLAEEVNCVEHHGGESCILPLGPGGVHPLPEHSRRASRLLERYLTERPRDSQARWLHRLTRALAGDGPDPAGRAPSSAGPTAGEPPPFPRWPNRAVELGVAAFDQAGGAVMDDFDGDGLLDLASSSVDPCSPLKAFRNDGRGGFEEVSEAWGLTRQLGGLNLEQADFDGDGDLDLLVLRGAWLGEQGRIPNSLLRNDLDTSGRFTDVTRAAGLAEPAYPTQAGAWGDYDGDGDLDLYLANEIRPAIAWPSRLFRDPASYNPAQLFREIRPFDPFSMLTPEASYPSQLFRNDGDGTFTDVAAEAGVLNHRFGKGAAWGDFDDDGDPDLFVANLGPNRLYRNDGDGTFTDVAPEVGAAAPVTLSFATWFFDHDNDGDLDLFVADHTSRVPDVVAPYLGEEPLVTSPPALLENVGGRFVDVAAEAGLDRPWLPMGANHGDLDNDGFPDLYLGTGNPDLDTLMPNVMLRNVGGERFEDVTFAGGFGHLQKGHGVAFGDLDNDGDQDLFEQMGGAYPTDGFANALYENPLYGREGTEPSPQRWITLGLRGTEANRFGVGARIEVVVRRRGRDGEELGSIHALAGSGGSFGASSLRQEIGLGAAEGVERVIVRWPGSGRVQVFQGLEPDRAWLLVEGEGEPRPWDLPRLRLGGSGASEDDSAGSGQETEKQPSLHRHP